MGSTQEVTEAEVGGVTLIGFLKRKDRTSQFFLSSTITVLSWNNKGELLIFSYVPSVPLVVMLDLACTGSQELLIKYSGVL